MNLSPQQQAAAMFADAQAAEVRTLDNLTTHNVPAGLRFSTDLDSLVRVANLQYKNGQFDQVKSTARILIDEASKQTDPLMKIAGEYHELRANDELGTMNMAHIDRILEHKELIGDDSNLGEIYFRVSRFKYKQGDIRAAKKFLKKAKKSQSDPFWTMEIADFDKELNPPKKRFNIVKYMTGYKMRSFNKIEEQLEKVNLDIGALHSGSEDKIGGSLLGVAGKFDRHSAFMGYFNGLKALNVLTIGHDFFRDFMHEIDLDLTQELYETNGNYPGGAVSINDFKFIGRQKIGRFYLEGGIHNYDAYPNVLNSMLEYTQNQDGSWNLKEYHTDCKGTIRLIEEIHSNIENNAERSGQRRAWLEGNGADLCYSYGAGIHNIILNKKLGFGINYLGVSVKTHDDGINISAAGFDGNNTFDVDLFDMDSGIRSKTVSINGELDIVNKPYVSLALLGKIPLSSDLEVYGLEVMQDLYKNYNIDQTLGIDVQGRIPLPSKMRLNLSATYLVERNLHGAVKPKFLVRAGIGFILGELW